MNTEYLIALQMCGFTRLEAILLIDELLEDGVEVLESFIESAERTKDVRLL